MGDARSKYPWDEWQDFEHHSVNPQDYDQDAIGLCASIYKRAKTQGIFVWAEKKGTSPEDEIVNFQFFISLAEKRKATAKPRRYRNRFGRYEQQHSAQTNGPDPQRTTQPAHCWVCGSKLNGWTEHGRTGVCHVKDPNNPEIHVLAHTTEEIRQATPQPWVSDQIRIELRNRDA